jgi:peptidyl-tRNA hydrolase, PTH1 family
MSMMIVGLGNPGLEYEHTRHNAGFMTVDVLGENLRASYWKDDAGALSAVVRFGEDELVLAKPQLYVNASGAPVKNLLRSYELAPASLVVVHDDLDLPPGAVRVKRGGGHGGHNGLRSLNDALGTGEYARVRVGIGRPPGRMDPADYVLQPMRGEALEDLEAVIPSAAQAAMHVLEHGVESAMREYNGD